MKKIGLALVLGLIVLVVAACSVAPEKLFAGDLEHEREPHTVDLSLPDGSTADPSGKVEAELDASDTTLSISGSFVGLTGDATAAHVHLGEEGISGGVVCTLDVSNTDNNGGTISGDCDVLVDEPDPVASGNINLEGLRGGDYYVNVHTDQNPQGEVRAQLE